MANIYLCVDKDGWTGGFQLSVDDDDGTGFRISGPKYNGSSKRLIRHRITERDVDRIREYLDKVKPAVAEKNPRDSSESTPPAVLSAPPPVSGHAVGKGWRADLESAPRMTGRYVPCDVWVVNSDFGGRREANAYRNSVGEWCDSGGNRLNWEDVEAGVLTRRSRVTHWMPLPEPPDARNLTGGAE